MLQADRSHHRATRRRMKMSALHGVVLTIGHSTHSMERFVMLLSQHRVTAVADVRSTPYSRFNPQFNRETLKEDLRKDGIHYVFLGQELGARSDDRSCYEKGRVQYSRLARTERFRHGVGRVVRGSETYQIALLCAEKGASAIKCWWLPRNPLVC